MSEEFARELRAKVEAKVKEVTARGEQAKRRIPEEYHDFLTFLDQNIKIGPYYVSQDLKNEFPGLWFRETEPKKPQAYLTVSLPYVAVDGRVAMFVDAHKKAGDKRFSITTYVEGVKILQDLLASAPAQTIADLRKAVPDELFNIMTAIVSSELYGSAVGQAKIGWKGSGVDATNPFENAQTSAVGRALGFLGFGLVGTGIASAEEVRTARAEQSDLEREKKATPPQPTAGAPTPKPSDTSPTPAPIAPNAPPSAPQVNAASPPTAAPTDGDPALKTAEGPCADCGLPFNAMQANAIITRRRNTGQPVRWSHASFPGYSCEKAKAASK